MLEPEMVWEGPYCVFVPEFGDDLKNGVHNKN